MLKSKNLTKLVSILCIAFILMQSIPLKVGAYNHTGGLYTDSQFDFIKSKVAANAEPWKSAYDQLISDANAWINEVPSAPVTWDCPGWYDDPDGHTAAKVVIVDDVKAAYACAMAYKFTGTTAYADETVAILNNWAYTNTGVTGADGDIALGYIAPGFLFAAELVKNYSGWASADKTQFNSWLTNVVIKIANLNSPVNGGMWGTLTRMSAYYFMDDTANFTKEVNLIRSMIDAAIDIDGVMPDETCRGDNGMWYTYFALAPLTAACQFIYNVTGEDLFNYVSPKGGCVKKALDYYLYYSQHVEEWPYNSDPNFPGELTSGSQWPLNLYEAVGSIYNNSTYTNYAQAYRPVYGPIKSGVYHHFAWVYPTLMYQAVQVPTPVPTPAPAVYTVDNTDSGFTTDGSAWTPSTSVMGYYGSDVLTDSTSTADTDRWAKWTPNIATAGNYNIYMRWTAASNRPDAAPIEIKYDSGVDTTKKVNQAAINDNGTWVFLGRYTLAAGTGNYVMIKASDAGYTIADAVRFVSTTASLTEPANGIYETETQVINSVSSGDTHTIVSDSNASGGKAHMLNAGSVGDFICYKAYVPAGTYNVTARVAKYTTWGNYQLSIDGTDQGPVIDTYSTGRSWVEFDLGAKTFATSGERLFMFTCVGRNANGLGYKIETDYIKLTSTTSPTSTPTATPTPTPTATPTPTPTPTPDTFIVDNSDSGFTTDATPWNVGSVLSGYYGTSYAHDDTSGADTDRWAKWTPDITTAGNYQIYMRWVASSNRPDAAPLEIQYDGGTDTSKTVNQRNNNATWVLIGTYPLSAGTGNYVMIKATDSGYTIADAVKFVKVP